MKSRPTMMKRARERARAEKAKEKAARRQERAQRASGERSDAPAGIDPDIAHIQAGPQPPADWQVDEVVEAEAEDADSDERD
jgi:hypothetical protein